MPLIGSDSPQGFSKEESRVLALQSVNQLNQRIGYLVRSGSAEVEEMWILQTFVNRLTVGIKTDNQPQMRGALSSIRNMIKSLEKPEEDGKS